MAVLQIEYTGTQPRLAEAVRNANMLLQSGNLLTIIRMRTTAFFNTARTCDDIAQAIEDCDAVIGLRMFTQPAENGWITTGYVVPDDRDTIHYNTGVTGNSVRSQTNTLVHEAVHVIDMFHDRISGFDFTHDGNDPTKPPQNRDSAPYWIGDRAEDLVDLLDDHVGQEKSFASLAEADLASVQRYLTDIAWSARRGVRCGTRAG